jgi:hypothetical protein
MKYLIDTLNKLPINWTLTPVFNKAPKIKNWQKGVSREIIIKEIESGRANGIGLITGILSGYILAIDCDGPTAHELAERFGGLPKTVSFTSGKKGRAQYLYLVPPEYQEILKDFTRKVLETGTKGEQLELRYNSMQSVLPPSVHPETQGYIWTNSIENTPIAELPTWVIEQILGDESKPSKTDQLPIKFNQLDEPIPLINCLSIEHRNNIKSGLGFDCGRNPMGFKIATDALGCELRLQHLGIPYTGTAKDLLDEFHGNCDKKEFTQGHIETIYKSAQKSNPTPCLSDDKLENCYKAWKRQQQQTPLISTSKSNYQTSGNAAFKPEPQSNVLPFQRQQETAKLPPIKEKIKDLLGRNLSGAELENEFLELSGIYLRYSKNAIESLYRKLSDDSEKQSDKTNQKNNLDKLLRLSQKTLDLSDYLHPNLATPLKNIAQYMGTSQEAILTTLLPTAASLIHLDTQLELIKATNFYAKPIIYSGIVAESGSLKSPTQKLITDPLMNLQEIADKDYESLVQNYQDDLEFYKDSLKDKNNPPLPVPTPPNQREYFVVDVTSEAVAGVQAKQPDRGFVGFQDELKALISSQNAYRGGKGSDAEKLLSGRDGSGIKVNRAGGKRLFCKRSGYSITGGIQPDVLRNLMGSFDDPNGFWARFIWCILPVAPSRYPENAASFDVNALLLDIYKKIENETPQIHKLSSEAKELYKAWYNQLDDLKLKEVRQGLRAVYSKMKGVTGEFALILHRTNAAVDGCQPDEYISKDAMAKAIKLSKFYISQIKLIHAEGEASQGEIAPQLKKLYDFALSQVSWLTASDIKKGCRLFKKSNPEDIRQSCLDLAEMGYGSTEGEGKSLKYCADIQRLTNINNLSTSTKKPETPINNGLQEFTQIIEVDKVDKKLTECQPSKIPINNGLQPLDDVKVDKLTHNTTDKNKNHNQLDENTDLLTERQPCQLSPSNPDIITVDTPSTSVNFASTLSTFSERPTAPTPTDYRPTQQELVNSQPLPPLIDLAKLIPFDSLYKGETIYDGNHTPYTLKQLVDGVWECTNGRFISPSNISSFHRAPKTAWD